MCVPQVHVHVHLDWKGAPYQSSPLQSLLALPMEQVQVSCALSSVEPASQEAWYPAAHERPVMDPPNLLVSRDSQFALVPQMEEVHGS